MTRVYIVRHAEAEGNLYRRIHGHYDSPLTGNGRAQLEALAKRFEGVKLDAVYCSDLARARETAKAIAEPKGLKPKMYKNLREVNFGEWEDKPWGEVYRFDNEKLDLFNRSPMGWSVSGAESFAQASKRMVFCVAQIAQENPDKDVAVVSHGSAMRALLHFFSRQPADTIEATGHSDNTAVSLVTFDDNWPNVIFKNDNSHLDPGLRTLDRQQWWRENGSPADISVWFKPIDADREGHIYLDFRSEAWKTVHGGLDGFRGESFLNEAREESIKNPQTLVYGKIRDDIAGMLQLNPRMGEADGVGHIPFYYMRPEYRGRGLAVQLMGHATSFFRELGRNRLRLRVSDKNETALSFYRKFGFYETGRENGVLGTLIVMEKDI